ncbi:DUF6567 family protein [Flavobacterium filum]|uniref:DUF6567 family protein n=1 Tax=Flavobacterium filum TaxID=370974 RepID=UPI0023EFD898|nr:DUF6567 family protein [Flavobacterium filum]
MKKVIYVTIAIGFLASCKPTFYVGSYGQVNQTQVVLSNSNFKVLGSFTGVATDKKRVVGVKHREGLVAQAKANLLANAKSAGVELTGSRALVNATVDVIQNENRVTVTVSAEIIEFTK